MTVRRVGAGRRAQESDRLPRGDPAGEFVNPRALSLHLLEISLTVFGERNDPLRFQPKWKALFPHARQVVIPGGNHFPMCDDPDVVADSIRSWHRETSQG